MDEDQKLLLQEFLAENWHLWEAHCEHRGVDPNDIYVNELGGEE